MCIVAELFFGCVGKDGLSACNPSKWLKLSFQIHRPFTATGNSDSLTLDVEELSFSCTLRARKLTTVKAYT